MIDGIAGLYSEHCNTVVSTVDEAFQYILTLRVPRGFENPSKCRAMLVDGCLIVSLHKNFAMYEWIIPCIYDEIERTDLQELETRVLDMIAYRAV